MMRNRALRCVTLWTVPLALAAALGCKPPAAGAPKPPSPAKVENPAQESALATIRLTPQAAARLGIATAPVEQKAIRRTRTLGGEVILPPGAAITLSAPCAGTVKQAGSAVPSPGRAFEKDAPVLALQPVLVGEARASALASRFEVQGALDAARAQSAAAKTALSRAEQLLRDEAGSRKTVDEARAGLEVSLAAVKAAAAKKDFYDALLDATAAAEGADTLVTLSLRSPIDGMVGRIFAVPGQLVSSGAPLLEIMDTGRLWVRVPVYAGDMHEIAVEEDVEVGAPGRGPDAPSERARPVAAPPSADLVAATVDLYYTLGSDAREPAAPAIPLAPGQRVAVTLALRAHEDSLVVPWSSVIHDSQGGTWVYEATAPETYVRRRVQVRFVAGDLASLASGPKAGSVVVTAGTAELFGTEFGAGK